ncbi:MAG TPA: hypothetical protein P5559_05875 [Candidatus Limiplasma sp.]|nr:hypothetical protein [Candidatus Limiplasma sp.]
MPPYVKLLLKTRLKSFNPFALFGLDKTKKKKVFMAFGLLLYGLMMAGYLIFMEYHLFQAFVQLGEPETMLAVVVVISSLLIVFLGFFYLLSELFFTKDLAFVSALPISSRQLMLAKLLRVWMGEALIALAMCLPVIIMYGIHAGKGIAYYLFSTILTLAIPLLPMIVVTLLSFVLVRLSSLWKHREALTMVFSVAFIFLVVFGQMQLTSSINSGNPADIMQQLAQSQHAMLQGMSSFYPPAAWFAGALMNGGLDGMLQWVLFAGVNVGALLLATYVLGGSYQQLAIRQSEARVRADASLKRVRGIQAVRTPLRALYRRELKEIFSSPTYALNCLVGGIMFPVMILFFSLSKQSGMSELAGIVPMIEGLNPILLVAGSSALFALAGSMNMGVATAISREGKRHSFYVTLPVPTKDILLSKLLMGVTIALLISLPMAIVLAVLLPSLALPIILGFVLAQLFMLSNAVIGLHRDIKHPKFGWKSETEAIKQNWVAAMSMFGGMAIVVSCAVVLYLGTTIGIALSLSYPVLCALALAADFWLLRRLFSKGSQAYLLAEAA